MDGGNIAVPLSLRLITRAFKEGEELSRRTRHLLPIDLWLSLERCVELILKRLYIDQLSEEALAWTSRGEQSGEEVTTADGRRMPPLCPLKALSDDDFPLLRVVLKRHALSSLNREGGDSILLLVSY